ncbi:MAG: gliding motility-associated C-terminal domain-containing protein [Flavobacteriales bacterium]
MKVGLYILIVLLGCSCLVSKKRDVPQINKFANSAQSDIDTKSKKTIRDTSLIITNSDCYYVVEDFSKFFSLPDTLNVISFRQSHGVDDTISFYEKPYLEIHSQTNDKIDTIIYQIKLRCFAHEIPQAINASCGWTDDTWEIPLLKLYPKNTTKVFNRWGNMVFEEQGYHTGWNGITNLSDSTNSSINHKILPEGTYFYIIDLGDSITEPYTGYIQLRR